MQDGKELRMPSTPGNHKKAETVRHHSILPSIHEASLQPKKREVDLSTLKEDSAFGPRKQGRKVDLSVLPSWMPGGKKDQDK